MSYTDEDARLVINAIKQTHCRDVIGPEHYACAQACEECCAKAALEALAASGRLADDFVRVRGVTDGPCPCCGSRPDTPNHEHGCETVSDGG